MRTKKFLAMAIALGLAVGMTAMPTLAAEKKTLVFGDTTFNAENEEADINPQNTYAGWACIRYGVGETLFRYSDTMEIEPWIAKEYENIDELTWKITLNDGVVFSNGRACDGAAAKQESARLRIQNIPFTANSYLIPLVTWITCLERDLCPATTRQKLHS